MIKIDTAPQPDTAVRGHVPGEVLPLANQMSSAEVANRSQDRKRLRNQIAAGAAFASAVVGLSAGIEVYSPTPHKAPNVPADVVSQYGGAPAGVSPEELGVVGGQLVHRDDSIEVRTP